MLDRLEEDDGRSRSPRHRSWRRGGARARRPQGWRRPRRRSPPSATEPRTRSPRRTPCRSRAARARAHRSTRRRRDGGGTSSSRRGRRGGFALRSARAGARHGADPSGDRHLQARTERVLSSPRGWVVCLIGGGSVWGAGHDLLVVLAEWAGVNGMSRQTATRWFQNECCRWRRDRSRGAGARGGAEPVPRCTPAAASGDRGAALGVSWSILKCRVVATVTEVELVAVEAPPRVWLVGSRERRRRQ